MKALWTAILGSLALVGCAAPSSLEGTHGVSAKDEAPVASITTAASSAMEQAYGIAQWKIYRSKTDIHMTGYDKSGNAVKGITAGFVKSANGKETQLRTKINDGSGFASFHGLKTHSNLANKSAMSAKSKAFVKAAFTDATKMNAIFRSQMLNTPSANATCGTDITAILAQSMSCMQGQVQTKAEQSACLAAAQNALSSANTCNGVGATSTVPHSATVGPRPNQTCDNATLRQLAAAKDLACNSKPSSCTNFVAAGGANTSSFCTNLELRQNEYQKCLDARWAVTNTCFGGINDATHQAQIDENQRDVNACEDIINSSCSQSSTQSPAPSTSSSSTPSSSSSTPSSSTNSNPSTNSNSSSSSSGSSSSQAAADAKQDAQQDAEDDKQAAADAKQDAQQDAEDDKQAAADAKQDAEQDAMDDAPAGSAQGSAATEQQAQQPQAESSSNGAGSDAPAAEAGGGDAPADSASTGAGADSASADATGGGDAPADSANGAGADSAPADAAGGSSADDSTFQSASNEASSQTGGDSVMGSDTSSLGASESNGDVSAQSDTFQPSTDDSAGASSFNNADSSFQDNSGSDLSGGGGDFGGGDSGGDFGGGGDDGGGGDE